MAELLTTFVVIVTALLALMLAAQAFEEWLERNK